MDDVDDNLVMLLIGILMTIIIVVLSWGCASREAPQPLIKPTQPSTGTFLGASDEWGQFIRKDSSVPASGRLQ